MDYQNLQAFFAAMLPALSKPGEIQRGLSPTRRHYSSPLSTSAGNVHNLPAEQSRILERFDARKIA